MKYRSDIQEGLLFRVEKQKKYPKLLAKKHKIFIKIDIAMNDKNLETLKFLKKISQVNKLSYNFYSVRNQANTLGSGAILTGQEV